MSATQLDIAQGLWLAARDSAPPEPRLRRSPEWATLRAPDCSRAARRLAAERIVASALYYGYTEAEHLKNAEDVCGIARLLCILVRPEDLS